MGIVCGAVPVWLLTGESRPPLRFERAASFSPSQAASPDVIPSAVLDEVLIPIPVEVRFGDTLVSALETAGLGEGEAQEAAVALAAHVPPRRLRAGTDFWAYRRLSAPVERVVFPLGYEGEAILEPAGTTWASRYREFQVLRQREVVRGRLADGGLETAMRQAGAPGQLAYRLADVLQWDLDFTRDLRIGDEFAIAYVASYVEGSFVKIDSIEAARYENRGKVLEAFHFGEGRYFDAEGRPMRKQFLRSPLPFSRVTSGFSQRRFHPVLGKYRPHYGVDYGAPTGTPVRATAGGTVSFVGTSGGSGRMVSVRHSNGFETSYLHLSRYAKGLGRGHRVQQGEVIGYVGATGLATAPHLDYRVKRNGKYIDPLSLRGQPAEPLSDGELGRFLTYAAQLKDTLTDRPQFESAQFDTRGDGEPSPAS